jgi:DNA-binding MarR family transcriptional regulator
MTAPTAPAHQADIDRGDLDAVADLLFRVGASFDGYTAQMRRAFGLNAHERLALAALWSQGPLTMTDLGAWIPLSRAAVTTLVDRMEEHGLCQRGSDASDRRRIVVQLTPAATERMIPVITPWGGDVAELVAGYDDRDWKAISEFLQQFAALNHRQAARLRERSDEELQALTSGGTAPAGG